MKVKRSMERGQSWSAPGMKAGWHRRLISTVLALLVAIASLVGGALPASAADLSSQVVGQIVMTNLSSTTGNQVSDYYQALVPIHSDSPVLQGDTFTVVFPRELRSSGSTGVPLNDANGHTLALCNITAGNGPTLTCTFTAYAATLSSVTGEIRATTQATTTTTGSSVAFQVGSRTVYIDTPGSVPVVPATGGNGGATPPVPPAGDSKQGWQQMPDNTIGYRIWVLASLFPAGQPITIHDALPQGLFLDAAKAPTLTYYESLSSWGNKYPADQNDGHFTNGQALPGGGTFSVSTASGSQVVDASFPNFDPGADGYYSLVFYTSVQGLQSGTVVNTATINGSSVTSNVTYVNQLSGTLWGPGYGGVTVTKTVDGTAAGLVPTGMKFTVRATPDSGSQQTTTLGAGAVNAQSWTFPAGTRVTVTEDAPTASTEYVWGVPRFVAQTAGDPNVVVSADGTSATVIVQETTTVGLSLTNTANPTVMNLVLEKSLVGSGPWQQGGPVSFTLTPSNQGPASASAGWSVHEIMPAGLILTGMSGVGYTCDLATATCVAGAGLAPNAKGEVINVTATIGSTFTGVAHNVAYVAPAPGDIVETNQLVIPSTATDTSATATDNDAQADVMVAPAPIPDIAIVKGDVNGNAGDDQAVPVMLSDGSVGLVFTVTNSGAEALIDVNVADATTGSGTVSGLSCDFSALSGPATGVTWAGPFAVGASFPCTASLSGVTSTVHTDTATVTGVGVQSETTVSSSDPYSAVRGAVSLGDLVWLDLNHNGIQDPSEPGIAGITLALTGPDGSPVTDVNSNPVKPVITGADGKYSFANLPILSAGEAYTVRVVDPAGYSSTIAQAVGSTTGTDSSTGFAVSGDLTTNGASDLTLDFGFWMPVEKQGALVINTGEPGGVTRPILVVVGLLMLVTAGGMVFAGAARRRHGIGG